MKKGKNILITVKDEGIQWLIKNLSELGTPKVKEYLDQFLSDGLSEISSDALTSTIPGVHGIVQGYKLRRFKQNMMRYIDELSAKTEYIDYNLSDKWKDHEEKINELHGLVMDYIESEQQVDKVEFFVNGFVNITEHAPESLSEDFVLTYYNLLNSLTLVDISVLRDIYFLRSKSFQEVVDEYDIRLDQYKSVQNNLFRMGLLTTKAEQENTSDLEKLFESVNKIIEHIDVHDKKIKEVIEGESKSKKLPELKEKNKKMRSKERFSISKFGRDFVNFFLYTYEDSQT